MKTTKYFKLRQPEGTDPVKVEDLNYNAGVIDEALHNAGGGGRLFSRTGM